ncbi:MAG: hypothetical protein IJD04_08020 [Desulfovibrionaceae bacterium]|nr:hypothetical protein [Desulfovibrionaceae bacterium]
MYYEDDVSVMATVIILYIMIIGVWWALCGIIGHALLNKKGYRHIGLYILVWCPLLNWLAVILAAGLPDVQLNRKVDYLLHELAARGLVNAAPVQNLRPHIPTGGVMPPSGGAGSQMGRQHIPVPNIPAQQMPAPNMFTPDHGGMPVGHAPASPGGGPQSLRTGSLTSGGAFPGGYASFQQSSFQPVSGQMTPPPQAAGAGQPVQQSGMNTPGENMENPPAGRNDGGSCSS